MAAAMAVPPMWLVRSLHCCFALRVLYALGHVTVPPGEARFAVLHAVSTVLLDFPLRNRNFGVI